MVVAAALGSPEASSAAVVDAVATGDARLALSDDYLDEMGRTMGKPYLEENASVGLLHVGGHSVATPPQPPPL